MILTDRAHPLDVPLPTEASTDIPAAPAPLLSQSLELVPQAARLGGEVGVARVGLELCVDLLVVCLEELLLRREERGVDLGYGGSLREEG